MEQTPLTSGLFLSRCCCCCFLLFQGSRELVSLPSQNSLRSFKVQSPPPPTPPHPSPYLHGSGLTPLSACCPLPHNRSPTPCYPGPAGLPASHGGSEACSPATRRTLCVEGDQLRVSACDISAASPKETPLARVGRQWFPLSDPQPSLVWTPTVVLLMRPESESIMHFELLQNSSRVTFVSASQTRVHQQDQNASNFN